MADDGAVSGITTRNYLYRFAHRGAAERLPKKTRSLCPDCGQLIDARIFEDGGKVIMEKRCDKHGDFRDIVYSDARLYLKMEEWVFGDNRGLENPVVTGATRCPDDCGLCNLHTSHTGLR